MLQMVGGVWLDNPNCDDDLENWVAALQTDFSQPLTAAQQQALQLHAGLDRLLCRSESKQEQP